MAILMVAPMVLLMPLIMRSMFPNRALNTVLMVGAIAVFVIVFYLIRVQIPIGNVKFLRSMIPHHSGAILRCQEASITDPEILELCDEIVRAQREEIAQMEDIRVRYR